MPPKPSIQRAAAKRRAEEAEEAEAAKAAKAAEAAEELPEGWEQLEIEGDPYYHNTVTGVTTWERPQMTEARVQTLTRENEDLEAQVQALTQENKKLEEDKAELETKYDKLSFVLSRKHGGDTEVSMVFFDEGPLGLVFHRIPGGDTLSSNLKKIDKKLVLTSVNGTKVDDPNDIENSIVPERPITLGFVKKQGGGSRDNINTKREIKRKKRKINRKRTKRVKKRTKKR